MRRWNIRRIVYEEALAGLDAVFASLGITYMPIKGAHLICTSLAGKIAAREMRDIDLLVRPADFAKTVAALDDHPQFSREPPDKWDFEQSFLYRHGNHSIHFELHRALNRPERFLLDIDELFDRATTRTAVQRIMTPEDALVVFVCHTLVHLVDGIPEHTFREADILIQAEGFSWEQFGVLLRATGIERFGKALLCQAARQQGFSLPPLLGPLLPERLLLSIPPPHLHRGIRTLLFRSFVELFFVRNPAGMVAGYLRGWNTAGGGDIAQTGTTASNSRVTAR
jgi:hypothetical protein